MEDNFLILSNEKKKLEINKIKKCNDYTSAYGLKLSDENIIEIMNSKSSALKDTHRVEFRNSIIDKIIVSFCDSPYIIQDNYFETLCDLIDIFYEYKNETMDLVIDDELIGYMKKNFDGICEGSIDYLSGTVLYNMREKILQGKTIRDIEEEDEEFE